MGAQQVLRTAACALLIASPALAGDGWRGIAPRLHEPVAVIDLTESHLRHERGPRSGTIVRDPAPPSTRAPAGPDETPDGTGSNEGPPGTGEPTS